MKKNNKKIYFVVAICTFLVLTFILLNSYAIWRVKESQTGTNYIAGACLKINFVEEKDNDDNPIGGFSLTDTWPMTDQEGISTKGYTFSVENTCSEEVNYQVVLESLTTSNENYLNENYVKVQLDNGAIRRYSELSNEANDATAIDANRILKTKSLLSGKMPGAAVKTHNVKVWIASDAGNDQIGKEFESRVRVYAGQGLPNPEYAITSDECFTFDTETGTIKYYNVDTCENNIVIPASIDGILVKNIEFSMENSPSSEKYAQLLQKNWDYVNLANATSLNTIGKTSFRAYVGSNYDLVIPESVETIQPSAFYSYNGSNLTLGSNLKTIGSDALYSYQGTDNTLIIPNSVTTIGSQAFLQFDGSNLVLGSSIETIGDYAFSGYKGKNQTLTIPNSVTSLGEGAFNNFRGSNLVIGSGITRIPEHAFVWYGSESNSDVTLSIPSNIVEIADSAFYSYEGNSIQFNEGLTTIGQHAFTDYNGADITLPSTITFLGNSAFSNLDDQKTININMTRANFENNVTKEYKWNGNATIHCLDD